MRGFLRSARSNDLAAVRQRLRGVCMIPASGEEIYATTPIGTSEWEADNVHRDGSEATDFVNAVADLAVDLPNCQTVLLAVAWYGTDLRASQCLVRPLTDNASKVTLPRDWAVADRTRANGVEVEKDAFGNAIFGGTPSDESVVEAIRHMAQQGYAVMFYPFMMMDIQTGNTLTNPYSGSAGQPVQPWRGQITTDRHRSISSPTDQTSAVDTHVSAFFGTVVASDITCSVNGTTNAVTYTMNSARADEWRFRRQILHYAKLCAAINAVQPGAVTHFLCGTKMRELLSLRNGSDAFPAVTAMATLIADVQAIFAAAEQDVAVSYAADWSEWNGFEASAGGFYHHLDPVWAAADFVGIDNYLPISDWHPATTPVPGGTDGAAAGGMIYTPRHLRSHIEGGEYYDYRYTSSEDRTAQTRTAITDPLSLGKPWVYRRKDLRNWWLNQHYDRPGSGSSESGSPTSWVPQSKPLIFTEFGCGKVNSATNQPNLFVDPASSEGGYPYFSTEAADPRIQLAFYRAWLEYFTPEAGHNPTSTVYGGAMLDIDHCCAWNWDARPFPEFPRRVDVWSDGPKWEKGHWLPGNLLRKDGTDPATLYQILWVGQSNAENQFYPQTTETGGLGEPGVNFFKRALATELGISASQIINVRGAKGGSSLLYKTDTKHPVTSVFQGHWWDERTNVPGPLAENAVALAQAASGVLRLIIWDQGETDWGNSTATLRPNNGGDYTGLVAGRTGVTGVQYEDAFSRLVAYFRTNLGADVPVLISGIGRAVFPTRLQVDAGTDQVPGFQYQLISAEAAQRNAINSISGVFRGPRRLRDVTGAGPEWAGDPILSDDGVHLVGGANGYGVHSERLAAAAAPIITGATTWTADGDTADYVAANELVVVGNFNCNTFFGDYSWGIASWSRDGSGNLSITTDRSHTLTAAMATASLVVLVQQAAGGAWVQSTLTSVPTSTTLVVAQAGAAASGTAGRIAAKPGARVMKDIITSHLSLSSTDLSVVDMSTPPSLLDDEVNALRNTANSYPSNFGGGLYWEGDHTTGEAIHLGVEIGDYLEQRGAAVRGLIIDWGEIEALFGTSFGGSYSITASFQPRLKALLQYWRTRRGVTGDPFVIYMVRPGGVYYGGAFFDYTVMQTAFTDLVADLDLWPIYMAAVVSHVETSDPATISIGTADTDLGTFTALGHQQLGTRLGDFIKENIWLEGTLAPDPPAPPDPGTAPTVVRSAETGVDNAFNVTFSVDATGGDMLLVLIYSGANHAGNPTVTFNGDSLTQQRKSGGSGPTCTLWAFYLLAPDQTTANVVVTYSGNPYSWRTMAHAVVISGANASTPIDDDDGATGTATATATVVTTGTDRLLVACVGDSFGGTAPSLSSPWTLLQQDTGTAASRSRTYEQTAATAGSYSATANASFNNAGAMVVALKA